MAMTTCKECGKEISSKAKQCPHCGAKRKGSFLKKLLIGVAGLIVLVAVFAPDSDTASTTSVSNNDKQEKRAPIQKSKPSGPSPEELSDEWWNYSRDKLENKLTQIMSQKDSNGEYVYQNYPVYSWSEQTGYVNCWGKLVYKQNGRGSASLSCPVGGAAGASGSWKIQWAPVTNSSPYSSDIIFTINESMKFSHHIGSDNKLWTSIDSFCKEHFSATDAQKMIAYGDSLRNAFMDEKSLIIGSDGRFKKK